MRREDQLNPRNRPLAKTFKFKCEPNAPIDMMNPLRTRASLSS